MYIAILRGINVSGHHLIKMESLRTSLQGIGLQQVETYIQSGNIVFQSKITDVTLLESRIMNVILQDFGYHVPCLVLHSDDLYVIVNQNPLLRDPLNKLSYFHVTFLSKAPEIKDLTPIMDKKLPDEAAVLMGRTIYLYCPYGYGKTKLTNNFIEAKLKVSATTRNWKTLQALLQMVSKNSEK